MNNEPTRFDRMLKRKIEIETEVLPIGSWSVAKQKIALLYLYTLGHRRDGVEHEIELAVNKELAQ